MGENEEVRRASLGLGDLSSSIGRVAEGHPSGVGGLTSHLSIGRTSQFDGLARAAEKFSGINRASLGLGDQLRSQMGEYDAATQHLRDALSSISRTDALFAKHEGAKALQESMDAVSRIPEPVPFPELPPNPLLKTNQLLRELKAEVAGLGDVTEATAAVQAKQAELINTILTTFVAGAAAAENSGRQNLRIARIGLAIAIIAIFLNIAQLAID